MVEPNPFLAGDSGRGAEFIAPAPARIPVTPIEVHGLLGGIHLEGPTDIPSDILSGRSFGTSVLFTAAYMKMWVATTRDLYPKATDEVINSSVNEFLDRNPVTLDIHTFNDLLDEAASAMAQEPWLNVPRDNKSVLDWLLGQRERFLAHSELRRGELGEIHGEFMERMYGDIDQHGLPLSHEQLEARVGSTELQFFDPLGNAGRVGWYDPVRNRLVVSIGEAGQKFQHVVFHELFHAASGKRGAGDIWTAGLSLRERNRTWMNEGITDGFATAVVGGETVDLGTDRPLWDLWSSAQQFTRVASLNAELSSALYTRYFMVAASLTQGVSARILANAYYKQDNDLYETDQRAGTHAERELQRAMKRVGGVGRVGLLRQLNGIANEALEDHQRAVLDDATTKTREMRETAVRATKGDAASGVLARTRKARAVRNHTKRYQRQITRAKRAYQQP